MRWLRFFFKDDWRERFRPLPVRYDPSPNPQFRIGLPRRPPTKGEMYEVHKNHGTLGIFHDTYERDR